MNKLLLLLGLSIGIFVLSSCDKRQDFALNILPEQDMLNTYFVDTLEVNIKTAPFTHIRTNKYTSVLVGSYKDPIFGYTKASCIFQIQQYQYPKFTDSNTTYTVDSVILYLALDPQYSPYGKPYNPVPLYLYGIKDTLKITENYYADQKVEDFSDGHLWGQTNFSLYHSDNDTVIKIYVDNQLGQMFIDSVDYYFFTEEGRFSDRFKGFVLTPGDQFYDAALYKIKFDENFDIRHPKPASSYLVMYYHPDTLPDTVLEFKLFITAIFNVTFTLIEHDYSQTTILDPSIDSVVYLQTAGTKLDIDIPGLKLLKNKVIHKAELILQLEDPHITAETSYPPPREVHLVFFDKSDTTQTPIMIEEYYNERTYDYFGFERNLNQYNIELTRLIQRMIQNPDTTKQLSIINLFKDQKLTRAVFTTQKNSNPLKLVLFYSDY